MDTPKPSSDRPLRVLWINDFPVERLEDSPDVIRQLPQGHPQTWKRVLYEKIRGRSDIELHIAVLHKQVSERVDWSLDNVHFHVLPIRGGFRLPTLFWPDTQILKPLAREIQPDVVHAWGAEMGAALVARRLGVPFISTVQGLLTWYRTVAPLSRYLKLASYLEPMSYRNAVVTTESTFSVDFLEKRFRPKAVHQVEHAPNPIFRGIERRPATNPVRFLFVGTPGYVKGTDLLLEALADVGKRHDFHVQIYGRADPDFWETMQARFPSSDLWSRVERAEYLTPEELVERMVEATLMVFPTRADTSPNAVKEAVVAGLPVVATKVGGIPDYVHPARNGELCVPGRADALVEAIERALAHPQFSKGEVDAATLAETRDQLSVERMAEGFTRLYFEQAGWPLPATLST